MLSLQLVFALPSLLSRIFFNRNSGIHSPKDSTPAIPAHFVVYVPFLNVTHLISTSLCLPHHEPIYSFLFIYFLLLFTYLFLRAALVVRVWPSTTNTLHFSLHSQYLFCPIGCKVNNNNNNNSYVALRVDIRLCEQDWKASLSILMRFALPHSATLTANYCLSWRT